MIRAVDVRCTGDGGRCRRRVALLFWPETPAEAPRLKVSGTLGYSLPRDLAGSVMLGCAHHNGNQDQREVS